MGQIFLCLNLSASYFHILRARCEALEWSAIIISNASSQWIAGFRQRLPGGYVCQMGSCIIMFLRKSRQVLHSRSMPGVQDCWQRCKLALFYFFYQWLFLLWVSVTNILLCFYFICKVSWNSKSLMSSVCEFLKVFSISVLSVLFLVYSQFTLSITCARGVEHTRGAYQAGFNVI